MERRLRRLRYVNAIVSVEAVESDEAGETQRRVTLRSGEAPHAALPAALAALAIWVRRICELPDEWCETGLTVTGVAWSYAEETRVKGAVITARAQLDCADSPLVINTPHLPFAPYSPTGNGPLMPPEAVSLLESLEAHALAYLDGKRAQGDLWEMVA